ncbi:MAG: hypothetical protein RRY38_00325, partial [Oscillospiraceae bacterium]
CNVASCQNHCNSEDYCSLDCVCIGTHETDPAMNQCTDCRSFRNRDINEQTQAVEQTKQQKQQQSGMTF